MQSLRQSATRKFVRVVSFDFDGCLFNSRFRDRKSPGFLLKLPDDSGKRAAYHQAMVDALFEANAHFFNELSKSTRSAKINKVFLMVGSNRQDCEHDQVNSFQNKTDSCFSALLGLREAFANKWSDITWAVDPYLLADTYGQKPFGHSFDLSIQDEAGELKAMHARYLFDRSKLSLLLMQTLKAAHDHPDETVYFDFFDDHDGILTNLGSFYQQNPTLLPANVVLRLNFYNGKEARLVAEVKGQNNKLERDFQASLFRMLECAGIDLADFHEGRVKSCDFISTFNAEQDRWRRFMAPQPVVEAAGGSAQHPALQELSVSIQLIKQHGREDDRQEAKDFVAAMEEAREVLVNDISALKARGCSDKKIENSHAMTSLKKLSAFAVKMSSPLVNGSELPQVIDSFTSAVRSDYRLRRFLKVLLAVAITAAAFVVGAAIGFGVGLGVGMLTGPGAIATTAAGTVAGAVVGVAIGTSIGATLFGATAGIVSGCKVNKWIKSDADADHAMLHVAESARALKAG